MKSLYQTKNRIPLLDSKEEVSFDKACHLLGITTYKLQDLIQKKIIHVEKDNMISKSSLLSYKEGLNYQDTKNNGKKWELKGDFATSGIKKMAKRTFQELASNVEELIVNSYDADSTQVNIILNLDTRQLSVIDNGNGMDQKTLASYAIYGQSEKSGKYSSPHFHRSPIGEYGMGGKLAISNIAKKCKIITRKNGLEHAFSMDKSILDSANYLSEVKRPVYTKACDKSLHGTTIFMEDLLYSTIDVERLVEKFSTKMPQSNSFKITMSVIENGKIRELEIKEPVFDYQDKFYFSDNLPLIGTVNLTVYFTKEPLPASKQGVWTKVNAKIINEKTEWFGLLNLTSGQKYRWRLYGHANADGLKDYVTFSKNDFIDCPQYRQYYNFVHKAMVHVQKTLLQRDEVSKVQKNREIIKEVEKEINNVLKNFDPVEITENQKGGMYTVKKVHTAKIKDAPETAIPDLEDKTPISSHDGSRGPDKKTRRNQSLVKDHKMNYKGQNYVIDVIDMSNKGDLVNFITDKHLIEINEEHPMYTQASKDGNLEILIRDVALTQIANDYSEGDFKTFNTVFNQLITLYVKVETKVTYV